AKEVIAEPAAGSYMLSEFAPLGFCQIAFADIFLCQGIIEAVGVFRALILSFPGCGKEVHPVRHFWVIVVVYIMAVSYPHACTTSFFLVRIKIFKIEFHGIDALKRNLI
ncbi:MAG: hypothetical protein IKG19_02475, partial [Lachnospiraceae bacterium]|nr:hypothetical protein [Lachnospiraceae bacterium]